MRGQQILHSQAVYDVATRCGLSAVVCSELLRLGWAFVETEGEPSRWVSPAASLKVHIPHHEPMCDGVCLNMAPHVHGLKCDRGCKECHAVCHPDCPAYKENANAPK